MGQKKKPDFVMNADGELLPTDELRSADLPEPKQKPKIELPAFPKSPAPAPRANPVPKAKVPPPPPSPPTDEIELAPPRIAKPSAAPPPPPVAKRPPPPLPPLDPREMVEPAMWSGERTRPDQQAKHTGDGNEGFARARPADHSNALAQLAQMAAEEEQLAELEPIASANINLADDLALPSRPTFQTPRPADEALSSAAEVEALIRDHKYRAVMEQVADIDGDESLDAPPPPPVQTRTPSQDVPVIRGTAVTPPPQRSPNVRPTVTGSGTPEEPTPRRGPPRVPLNRTIKEKNRGSR
jgi:hypothetical protein